MFCRLFVYLTKLFLFPPSFHFHKFNLLRLSDSLSLTFLLQTAIFQALKLCNCLFLSPPAHHSSFDSDRSTCLTPAYLTPALIGKSSDFFYFNFNSPLFFYYSWSCSSIQLLSEFCYMFLFIPEFVEFVYAFIVVFCFYLHALVIILCFLNLPDVS